MATLLHENLKAGGSSLTKYLRAAFFRILVAVTALIHFALAANWVHRWYVQHANEPKDWVPDSFMITPFHLLFASAFLLLGRWWGNLIAFLISAWLVSQLSVAEFNGISNAFDRPMFSRFVLGYWLRTKFEYQRQELFQLGLALVIFSYAVADSSRHFKRALSRRHP